jgi:hypothetical protein
MKEKIAVVLVTLLPLLACKSLKEKVSGTAASATPKTSAAASAPAPAASVAGNVVPAPESPVPRPLKVGQFVRYKVTEKGQEREFSYAIVGEEAGAHWIQVVTEKTGRRVVIQILLRIGNRSQPNSAKLLAVKMKMGPMVREFRGATLAAMRKRVDDVMGDLVVPGLDGLKQEDVTVPAGTFKSCYVRDAQVTMFGLHSESRQWFNTRVPLLPLVKSKGLKTDYMMELAEYGETGAKNEL